MIEDDERILGHYGEGMIKMSWDFVRDLQYWLVAGPKFMMVEDDRKIRMQCVEEEFAGVGTLFLTQ